MLYRGYTSTVVYWVVQVVTVVSRELIHFTEAVEGMAVKDP